MKIIRYDQKEDNYSSAQSGQTNSPQREESIFNFRSDSNSDSSYSVADIFSDKDSPIEKLFGNTYPVSSYVSSPFKVQGNNTKDGQITGTYQRGTGDCWLLAGVNAISYTEKGRQLIHDALDYKENGDTVVHLKGAGDYVVTKEELEAVKNKQRRGSKEYSVGDDDMLIMEIAIEKVMDDIATKRVKLSSNAPAEYENQQELLADLNTYKNSITGGQITELMYLLTGKQTEYLRDKNSMENALNDSMQKDVALGAAMMDDKAVRDVNGNTVQLYGRHAYSVKNVTGDTVTVINPWNSAEEIVLSRETFMSAFDNISKCDLTDDNKDVNYIMHLSETDDEGNRIYELKSFEARIKESVDGKDIDAVIQKEVYDKYGNLKEIIYTDENGNEIYTIEYIRDEQYDSNGDLKEEDNLILKSLENISINGLEEEDKEAQEKDKKVSVTKSGNGDSTNYEIRQLDEDGNVIKSINLNYGKIQQNIINKNLFGLQTKNLDEKGILERLSQMEWADLKNRFAQ